MTMTGASSLIEPQKIKTEMVQSKAVALTGNDDEVAFKVDPSQS